MRPSDSPYSIAGNLFSPLVNSPFNVIFPGPQLSILHTMTTDRYPCYRQTVYLLSLLKAYTQSQRDKC